MLSPIAGPYNLSCQSTAGSRSSTVTRSLMAWSLMTRYLMASLHQSPVAYTEKTEVDLPRSQSICRNAKGYQNHGSVGLLGCCDIKPLFRQPGMPLGYQAS